MNCEKALAIVRPTDPAIGTWLMTWLNSRDAKRQIGSSSVTATISNLSLSQLGQLTVPVSVRTRFDASHAARMLRMRSALSCSPPRRPTTSSSSPSRPARSEGSSDRCPWR